ncbi:MAG: RHS repeat protein [Lachnospiraceae bacterium]|nr:RHS repeat protein [Lachnospiraceae bacterium]
MNVLLYLSAAAFPVCGLLMYRLTMHYGTIVDVNDMAQLNSMFHSRLDIGHQAITNYGIHWFGNYYNQIGAGFSQTMPEGYNFIDSAYILLLVRYGILVSAAFVIGFVVSSIRGTKTGNIRMTLAVMLIAGHSVLEHHAPELNYNIFLLLPVLGIARSENREESILDRIKGMLHQNKILQIWTGTVAVAALFLVCRLNYVVSLVRTVVTLTASGADEKGRKLFIWILLAVIGMVVGIFYAWYQLGAHKSHGKSILKRLMQPKRVLIGMISIGIIGLSAMIIFVHNELSLGMLKYANVIAEEQNVLSWINQTDNPRLYVDDVPVLYHKANANNTYSVYSLEDLARKTDSTILTNKDNHARILLDRGFLFAEISDEHAIYTTDREVIDLLREKGYHFTSYYSVQKEVDLDYMAECNGLEQGESGEVILTSEHSAMPMGPYAYLWGGIYKVTYHLRIPPETKRSEEILCTLVPCADYGNNIRKEQKVYLDEFAEDGSLIVDVVFSVGNVNGVEFKAFLNADLQVDLAIEKITYQQTVSYDTIYYYDEKGQNNRTERYDEEGNRILQDGYWAVEYEYNKAGQNTVRKYYDENNAPVKIADGYAEIHMEYNAANKLVRESYYDESGQSICSVKGYATEEREYDQYGNAYEYRYYGEDGNLILRPEGYAIAKYEYDDKNRCIAEHYYGTDEAPVLKNNSFASITFVLDETGNHLEERTFGINGEPVICQSGYAEIHRQFNENQKEIRQEYYDVSGKLMMRNGECAITEFEYDEAGNVSAKRYYGVAAEPIMYHDEFWQVRSTYNENRKIIHEEYYGVNGEPVLRAQGYASYDAEYDRNGNATVYRYYDTAGNPIVNVWGYAEVQYSYNEKNQNIYETYYDVDGARKDIGGGRYATGREYDENGNVISIRYFGAEDEPVMHNAGYHEVRYTYNDRKQVIREEFYDADRIPVLNSQGFFADEREYDEDGNQSSIRYYDLQRNEIYIE